MVGAAPIFIVLSTQYLAEAAQTLAVAWFVLIMARAPRWRRSMLAAHLVAATAFAMLAKTTSPALLCRAGAGRAQPVDRAQATVRDDGPERASSGMAVVGSRGRARRRGGGVVRPQLRSGCSTRDHGQLSAPWPSSTVSAPPSSAGSASGSASRRPRFSSRPSRCSWGRSSCWGLAKRLVGTPAAAEPSSGRRRRGGASFKSWPRWPCSRCRRSGIHATSRRCCRSSPWSSPGRSSKALVLAAESESTGPPTSPWARWACSSHWCRPRSWGCG